MAAGKFEEAVPIYRQLVRAVPGNPGLLLNLGMALHLAGHSRQALDPLQSALKLDKTLAPAWLFLGDAYLGADQPARAVAPLKHYLELQRDDPGGHQSLGDALLALNQFRDAAAEFGKVAAADERNAHAWYGLERCSSALAQAAFQKVENTAPESGYWLALVGDERLVRRQLQSAFFFYRHAAAAQPDLPGVHASIAEVYRESGHSDWADMEMAKDSPPDCAARPLACAFIAGRYEEVIRSSQDLDTPEAAYWNSRAWARLARQAFDTLEKLPESAEIHELRASQLVKQRHYSEAVSEWRNALQFAPGDFWLREQLLSAQYQARDYDAALRLADQLLGQAPGSAELNLTRGEILLSQQQVEQAIPPLQAALRADPALVAAHEALGRAQLQVGHAAEAIPHLRAALSLDRDGSLRYELSKAYQAAGQPGPAKQMLAEYQTMQKRDRETKQRLEGELQITAP